MARNHRLRIPTPQIQILEISRKEKERAAFAFNKSTTISLNNSPAPPPSSPPTIPHPLGKLEPRLPVSRGGEGRASARYDGVHRHGFIYLTTLPFKKSQSGRQRGSSGRRAPSASQFRRRERTTKTNPNRVVRLPAVSAPPCPRFLPSFRETGENPRGTCVLSMPVGLRSSSASDPPTSRD